MSRRDGSLTTSIIYFWNDCPSGDEVNIYISGSRKRIQLKADKGKTDTTGGINDYQLVPPEALSVSVCTSMHLPPSFCNWWGVFFMAFRGGVHSTLKRNNNSGILSSLKGSAPLEAHPHILWRFVWIGRAI